MNTYVNLLANLMEPRVGQENAHISVSCLCCGKHPWEVGHGRATRKIKTAMWWKICLEGSWDLGEKEFAQLNWLRNHLSNWQLDLLTPFYMLWLQIQEKVRTQQNIPFILWKKWINICFCLTASVILLIWTLCALTSYH